MGGCNSKKTGKRLRNIPPGSPLGELLEKWDLIEDTKGLDKIKMIHYCVEVWPELEMQGGWPWCGTRDKWICQQLSNYLTARGDTDPEQLLYVDCWLKSAIEDKEVRICKVQKKKDGNEGGEAGIGKRWDPLDYLPPAAPPPYNPLAQAPPMAGPVLPPAAIPLPPPQIPPSTSSPSPMIDSVSPLVTTPSPSPLAPPVPSAPPQVTTPPAAFSTPSLAPPNNSFPPAIAVPLPPPSWDTNASLSGKLLSPNTPADLQKVQGNPDIPQTSLASEDGPYCGTRSKTSKAERLFPLREVPMGGAVGGVGFVNAPLTASEVRGFKKELGHLVEDPVGIANQVDQFLGPNIYTWGEMNSILNILFSSEEVQMIRAAGIRLWERDNRPGPQVQSGEQKLPLTDPNWNPNQEEGRKAMMEYRSLMIRGIKESVPKGTNTKLAFEGTQEKDETPAAWLNRLKRNFQLYSRIDPDTTEGQMLLKVQFVTKSWPDIRRKLEKIEEWQNKDINELLREALKVYLRRDEEKAKAKARIMVAVARESGGASNSIPRSKVAKESVGWVGPPPGGGKDRPLRQSSTREMERPQTPMSEKRCYYCGEAGHTRRFCKKLSLDVAIAREQDNLERALRGDD